MITLPIFVRLAGGLGNQLFQLAHAVNLQAVHRRPVLLDASPYHRPWRRDKRSYDLEITDLPIRVTTYSRLALPLLTKMPYPLHRREALSLHCRAETLYQSGYFQSTESALKALPLLANYLTRALHESRTTASPAEHIAIHCRLGDYLDKRTSATHGVTDPIWLVEQADDLRASTGISTIRIFTDSPETFKRFTAQYLGDHHSFSDAQKPWEVLAEMSQAHALVMSNSSLSWWAAFIATQGLGRPKIPPAQVVMPSPWLASPTDHDAKLYHAGWTQTPRRIILPDAMKTI